MLSIQNIVQLIASPRKLNREETEQLRQLIARFPYSQVFPILYLKSLALAQDVLLDDEIQRLAIRIQDRQVLFNLIHNKDNQLIKKEESNSSIANSVEEELSNEKIVALSEINEVEIEESKTPSIQEITTIPTIVTETTLILKDEPEVEEQLDVNKLTKNNEITPSEVEVIPTNAPIADKEELQQQEDAHILDREALQHEIQLQKAFELQKQQDKERQILIDKLTSKPRPLTVNTIDSENNEKIEEETSKASSEGEARSFTSWLNSAPTQKVEQDTRQNSNQIQKPIENDPFIVNSAVYSLEKEEEIEKKSIEKKENDVPVKKNVSDLIDKFIKEDPRISKPKKIVEKPVPERTEMYNPMKKGKESLNDTQLPVSETLAKIFVVQGNFPKAIFAYQQLMLIFPEKKAFFAKQIKELEKKLNTK